jgi:hypothetical protein
MSGPCWPTLVCCGTRAVRRAVDGGCRAFDARGQVQQRHRPQRRRPRSIVELDRMSLAMLPTCATRPECGGAGRDRGGDAAPDPPMRVLRRGVTQDARRPHRDRGRHHGPRRRSDPTAIQRLFEPDRIGRPVQRAPSHARCRDVPTGWDHYFAVAAGVPSPPEWSSGARMPHHRR